MLDRFPWPPCPGLAGSPVWQGRGFKVGDKTVPILAYETGASGWTDDLTAFHEDSAGSTHVMDRSSRQHALEQLKRYIKNQNSVILEVGCSSGFMLQLMRENFPSASIVGSDYVLGPLKHLAQSAPDIPLMQFDVVKCPLPDGCVDAVVLLNVLEHIDDDAGAVKQLFRILRPGGIAVIEVPAGPGTYDIYDKVLMHFRRYTMKGLTHTVTGAGFQVLERSHLGCFMYPAFWLVKQRSKRLLSLDIKAQQEIVARNIRNTRDNVLLSALVKLELLLGRFVSYPFGVRCLMTCRKPG